MQTDIPLKRLTALCAEDLLPLIGGAGAAVVAVETLELPATAARLDSVLRLRSPLGQEYLHVVEWQGYADPAVLWRLAGYMAWLGQRSQGEAVVGTVIYLTPAADQGDTLRQTVDGRDLLGWRIPAVPLWRLDADAAFRHGGIGLAILCLLMRGASEGLVEGAVARVLEQAPAPQQAELLSILGVFAEPLMSADRFVRLVGKERMMASDLISYLMEEKVAELEQRHAEELERRAVELERRIEELKRAAELERRRAEEERARRAEELERAAELERRRAEEELERRVEAERRQLDGAIRTMQDAVFDTIVLRFPSTPAALARNIRSVSDLERLAALQRDVLRAADQAAAEALLAALYAGP